MITQRLLANLDRTGWIFLGILLAALVLVPISNLALPPTSALHVPTHAISIERQVWYRASPSFDQSGAANISQR